MLHDSCSSFIGLYSVVFFQNRFETETIFIIIVPILNLFMKNRNRIGKTLCTNVSKYLFLAKQKQNKNRSTDKYALTDINCIIVFHSLKNNGNSEISVTYVLNILKFPINFYFLLKQSSLMIISTVYICSIYRIEKYLQNVLHFLQVVNFNCLYGNEDNFDLKQNRERRIVLHLMYEINF